MAQTDRPIWGSLSWLAFVKRADDSGQSPAAIVLVPGRLTKTINEPVVDPHGKKFAPPVDQFELSADGSTLRLTDLMSQIDRFETRFTEALTEATVRSLLHKGPMPKGPSRRPPRTG